MSFLITDVRANGKMKIRVEDHFYELVMSSIGNILESAPLGTDGYFTYCLKVTAWLMFLLLPLLKGRSNICF